MTLRDHFHSYLDGVRREDRYRVFAEWGAPVRLRIPVKLGFKSAKNLESIAVTNTYPGGYWENQGYDWFSGV
jgi:DMSO/TMAO reductase YedYZ molybdopterin-dependent catalytic subunit